MGSAEWGIVKAANLGAECADEMLERSERWISRDFWGCGVALFSWGGEVRRKMLVFSMHLEEIFSGKKWGGLRGEVGARD